MSQVERQEVPQSVKWGSWFLVGAPFARIPGLGTGTLGVELRAEPPLGSESLGQFLI